MILAALLWLCILGIYRVLPDELTPANQRRAWTLMAVQLVLVAAAIAAEARA